MWTSDISTFSGFFTQDLRFERFPLNVGQIMHAVSINANYTVVTGSSRHGLRKFNPNANVREIVWL